MPMTILGLLQEFCDRRGLDSPSIVMSSGDPTIRQLKGLANECLADLTGRGHSWSELQKQTTFNSVAAELQGAIATLAPFGFKYIIPDSLFDRTERRPLYGPRNAPAWQESTALPTTGPFYSFRVWQGNFYLQPAPPAAHTIAFEYASDMAILAANGVDWKKRFTADDDVFKLDEDLMLAGLNWRWRREQGLSYSEEQRTYEALVAQAIGAASEKGELSLTGGSRDLKPGIFVPSCNWPVS